MITENLLSTSIGFLAGILGDFAVVTDIPFNLDYYLGLWSGTIQNLGALFPPIATAFTLFSVLIGWLILMFTYRWTLWIIRLFRG